MRKICIGCNRRTIGNFPALSRYGYGDICSDCGTKEAFQGNFIKDDIIYHIDEIISYLHEEKKHWEESGKPKDHIYTSIQKVKQYFERPNIRAIEKRL